MNTLASYQPRSAWAMASMLTWLSLINFLDKIVLGMVAVPLMADLRLPPAEFGLIASSFFWLFSLSTVLVGFLSNRVAARWLLLAMGLSWAVLQVPLALAGSAMTILVCRMLLGAAEGPAFPISVHALFKWFPDHKRNLPVAMINQGATVGLLLAGLLIPLVTMRWGWRANFMILAGIGMAWSAMWLCVGREGPITQASASRAGTAATPVRLPYLRIFRDPTVLACLAIGFCAYWALALGLTWLPAYLEKGLGFDPVTTGRWYAAIVASAMPVTLILSWLSQRMLRAGASSRLARGVLISLAALAGGGVYLAIASITLAPVPKTLLIAVAACLPPVAFALTPAMLAQIVPEGQRGSVLSIHTALVTLAGILAPAVVGQLVQRHGMNGGFDVGFTINALLLLASGVIGLCWINPERSAKALAASPRDIAAARSPA
ncbi:MFS transporter [Cupriavidus sp. UME77]|uniref:MFS transporter n=1 Tax=Cupriavidus sp. UME77 TaxID=1862321 RepID=UPI001602BD5C|nr:MFS transporter [Cupriavidus sp. UME77]MBB1633287.1 MFS transporter [Cupriavidus sp. UME77]